MRRHDSYDSLLIAHVLEHMTPAEASDLLAAYLPYLRSEGRVVIIVPQEAGFRSDATHVTFLDLEDIAGFEAGNELARGTRLLIPLPSFRRPNLHSQRDRGALPQVLTS